MLAEDTRPEKKLSADFTLLETRYCCINAERRKMQVLVGQFGAAAGLFLPLSQVVV